MTIEQIKANGKGWFDKEEYHWTYANYKKIDNPTPIKCRELFRAYLLAL